jgi:hypothetical protein
MCTESANIFLVDGVCVCVCNGDAHIFLSKMHIRKYMYILRGAQILKKLGAM